MEWTENLGLWIQACRSCRLCMDNPGTVNIFTPIDWSQDILTHTGIKVSQTHQEFHGEKIHMPLSMCETCHDSIQNAKILKDGAQRADKKWRLKRQELQLPPDKGDQVVVETHTIKIEKEIADGTTVNKSCQRCSDRSKKHKKKKRRKSPEHQDTKKHLTATSSKTISVRKDLFGSSQTSDKNSKTCQNKNTTNGTSQSLSNNINTTKMIPAESSVLTTPQVLQILLGEDQTGNMATPLTSEMSKKSPIPKTESQLPQRSEKKLCTKRKSENTSQQSPLKIAVKYQVVNGRQEFKCEICNKIFTTKKKLYIHNLSHNKKYFCPLDVCGKRFAIKGDLEKHIRSHTGERPYKCHLCDQSFSQKGTLKAHDENVHREKHN